MDVKEVPGDGAKRLKVLLKGLKKSKRVGKVGWFKSAKYDNAAKTLVAKVAAVQEFGDTSKSIPPRPYMRPTIQEKKKTWSSLAKRGTAKILDGSQTAEGVLMRVALKAKSDIETAITNVMEPPLAPATIRARLYRRGRSATKAKLADSEYIGGLSKPLVDTGLMFGTLDAAVEDE